MATQHLHARTTHPRTTVNRPRSAVFFARDFTKPSRAFSLLRTLFALICALALGALTLAALALYPFTTYAKGYSDPSFWRVATSHMNRKQVLGILGNPISIQRSGDEWRYKPAGGREICLQFRLPADSPEPAGDPVCDDVYSYDTDSAQCKTCYTSIFSGEWSTMRHRRASQVIKAKGRPATQRPLEPKVEAWHYSYSASGGNFFQRVIYFNPDTGLVEGASTGTHWD